MHARGVAGRGIGVEREGGALLRASPSRRRRCRPAASGLADRPGCRSAGRDRFSTPRIAATSSRMRSCGVWLMLMRNTSAPASNRRRDHRRVPRGGPERGDDLGAAQASHRVGAFGSCDGDSRGPASAASACAACSGRCCGPSAVSVSCTVQDALLAGVDLEEAGAVEAARQAILGALDGEFLVARAHEGLAGPFAAAVVVDRVDVIEARDQGALAAASRRSAPTDSTSLRWSSPSVSL